MGIAYFLILVWLTAMAADAHAAFDPRPVLPGFKRTSWTIENDAPPAISTIAQTRDGFLWLGTQIGLYRFDGVAFERLLQLEKKNGAGVMVLHVTRSGDLWAGYGAGGLGRIRNGRLQAIATGGPTGFLKGIADGSDGDIWFLDRTALFRLREKAWTRWPIDGFGSMLLVARDGTIWVTTADKLHVLRPGSDSLEVVAGSVDVTASIAEDRSGTILVVDSQGMRAVASPSGRTRPFIRPGTRQLPAALARASFGFDHEGALWMVGHSRTILRIRQGGAQGLSIPAATDLFEAPIGSPSYSGPPFRDREGNIWIATELGLDRFRPVPLVHETAFADVASGTQADVDFQVLTDGLKQVFVRRGTRLFKLGPGRTVTPLPWSAGLSKWDRVCGSRVGGFWFRERIDRFRRTSGPSDRVIRLPLGTDPDPAYTSTCVEDRERNLWVGLNPRGFQRFDGRGWRTFRIDPLKPTATPFLVGTDRAGDALAYHGYGDLVRMRPEGAEVIWPKSEISLGFIEVLYPGPRYLLVGGESGLARFDGRQFKTLSTDDYPFLQDVSGIVQTRAGDTWLVGKSGIVRMRSADLEARFDEPGRALPHEIFDNDDGLFGFSEVAGWTNAVEARDGRLWFATNNGIFSLHPDQLSRNRVPPPVTIRRVIADGVLYSAVDGLMLPKGITSLQVDYTALSLSVPKRVRFRYRLLGQDGKWVDPGSRRQAFFTNLAPGDYKFEVLAANNDGVWNRSGASATFTIPPTFVQSRLFLLLCVVAGLLALWTLYALRLRQITVRLRASAEERHGERERIARELHDTLLQSVQALILKFQAVADDLPERQPARHKMLSALDLADTLLAEGRDRVQGLRSTDRSGNLDATLCEAARRILTDERPTWKIVAEGTPRPVDPLVGEAISRIGEEALFNIARHAHADQAQIEIKHGRRELAVAFRDDGVGIDRTVLQGGREGHFGLIGMRERAEKVGGTLRVSSSAGRGTTISLTVPAKLAYGDRREWRLPFVNRQSFSKKGA